MDLALKRPALLEKSSPCAFTTTHIWRLSHGSQTTNNNHYSWKHGFGNGSFAHSKRKMSSQRRPLTSRWLGIQILRTRLLQLSFISSQPTNLYSTFLYELDLLYFIYFTTHIPATLLVDTNGLFSKLFDKPPYVLTAAADYYIETYNDPLFVDNKKTWFSALSYTELLIQTPFFFYAAIGLWKGKHQNTEHWRVYYIQSTADNSAPHNSTFPVIRSP